MLVNNLVLFFVQLPHNAIYYYIITFFFKYNMLKLILKTKLFHSLYEYGQKNIKQPIYNIQKRLNFNPQRQGPFPHLIGLGGGGSQAPLPDRDTNFFSGGSWPFQRKLLFLVIAVSLLLSRKILKQLQSSQFQGQDYLIL